MTHSLTFDALPVRLHLSAYAGAGFGYVLTYEADDPAHPGQQAPVNLTGYTARLDLADGTSFTSAAGKILLGGPAGTVTVALAAGDTAGRTGSQYYCLWLVPPAGEPVALADGLVSFNRGP